MGEAAREVAEFLLNVPQSYNLELARFNATAPFINPNLIASLPVLQFPVKPTPLTPVVGPGPDTISYTINGPFYVTTQAQNAEVLFEDIKRVAHRKGRALGGLNGSAGDSWDI